jgi:hypothetical protein
MNKLFVLTALCGLLIGCSGGGGSAGPSAPPVAHNLQSAPLPTIMWDAEVIPTTTASVQLFGTVSGVAYVFGIDATPFVPVTFDGQLANDMSFNWSLEQVANPLNGTFGTSDSYYLLSPYLPLGELDGTQVTSWTPPSSLMVGASGQLATFNANGDAKVETYAVTEYSPSAVLVTITETGQQPSDASVETYTVDASGNEQLVSASAGGNVFTAH